MAIIKCKMCGGDLTFTEGASTAHCEWCDSVQTIPVLDDEKKLVQFERAERLRKQCEFDKAAGIYENIVADYRQEAEAYWGLVLCKYGIEYVDDPATGKKIPTCHRSSFESIMDDPDLEQALENADGDARKVYREEAKAIEEIRKGIISVSSTEKPYDIFICYKETDPKGDRTLDSVLAQDIYDKLTDKGYRVFFSRITLEDKLGLEYEPYIFAALNSAKVMLVFGTDYEYFNAVWVKNEWSRFLKLMAKDKEKHLIPCFKGIDAYDMPKEFAKLQSQDLGKVGADQDLLRGIEKLLPRKTETKVVVQEQVVVGGSGNNKIASLLDRGNMALEDGDWAKADSFFEDVLNNDSKNAQAYLGKTLAQEKCRTIDAFIRKRKDATQNAAVAQYKLEPNQSHIRQTAEKYAVPHYLDAEDILLLYRFDLSYSSTVADRKKQLQDEENYWKNHKQLSRAEQFATGAVAENLANEKKALFDFLRQRIQKAEADENAVKQALEGRYIAFIEKTDTSVQQRHESACSTREANYQTWCRITNESSDIPKLRSAKDGFQKLQDYRDSKAMLVKCNQRITEETAKAELRKRQQEEAKKAAEAKQQAKEARQGFAVLLVIVGIIAAVIIFLIYLFTSIIPGNKYEKADTLYKAGSYAAALDIFVDLEDYEDSQDRAYTCCETILKENTTAHAAIAFGKLGDYKDAKARSRQLWDQIVPRETFVLNSSSVAAIDANGCVVTGGDLFGEATGWDHCISLVMSAHHGLIALKDDGKILSTAAFFNDEKEEWENIVSICGNGTLLVGLKADGTVVTNGSEDDKGTKVSKWENITQIYAAGSTCVGIDADGKIYAAGTYADTISGWTDIESIYADEFHIFGFKKDGTAVAVGENNDGECEVSEWRDVVTAASGSDFSIGLRKDGTAVAAGDMYSIGSEVSGWSDLIDIGAQEYCSYGLRKNGTVVTNDRSPLTDTWQNVIAIYVEDDYIIGIQADGTVLCEGSDKISESISQWPAIQITE